MSELLTDHFKKFNVKKSFKYSFHEKLNYHFLIRSQSTSFTDSVSEAISYSFTKSLSTMRSYSSASSESSGGSNGGGSQEGFSLFGISFGGSSSGERRWDSSSSSQSSSSSSSETVNNSFKYRTISQKLSLKLRHKKF